MKIESELLFACHELNEKEKRNLLIYDLIRKKGAISRAEITKATGINAVSVSHYVNNFIEKKLVLEKGFDISTGGRKPELVELNPGPVYVAGVDVGKNEIRGTLTDIALGAKAGKCIPRPNNREVPGAVVRLVEEMICDIKTDASSVKTIGLGLSDPKLANLASAVRKGTGVETYSGPSAVCAAFAEKCLNKEAESLDDLLYIYSDVGEGVVIRRDTYMSASEDTSPDDDKLRYLNPWDDYLSIAEGAKREVAKGVGTKIVSLAGGRMENITREVVIAAAMAEDEVALNIAFGVGINLGLRIAYLINLFSPKAVAIGGGTRDAGDIMFTPIRKMIERLAFRNKMKDLRILLSASGENAPETGAAALAVREIFIKA